MATLGDVLNNLNEIYEDGVQKADEDGFAQHYERCTKVLFKQLKNWAKRDKETNSTNSCHFTPYNIQYQDGYFIFGTGTNSVITFKVRECPGWLFGIWWSNNIKLDSTEDEQSKKNIIHGEFFTQYQETIDKFKPSRSIFEVDFDMNIAPDEENNLYGGSWHIWDIIKFIHNEPYLAFCRDYYDWDYNLEYHSREEAYEAFMSYKDQKKRSSQVQKQLNLRMQNFAKKYIMPQFQDAQMIDRGEGWSPRYCIIVPLESNLHLFNQTGWYSWFIDPDKEQPKDIEIRTKFNKLLQKCQDRSQEEDVFWYNLVDTSIQVYSIKEQ